MALAFNASKELTKNTSLALIFVGILQAVLIGRILLTRG
jgi:hypothetical protein